MMNIQKSNLMENLHGSHGSLRNTNMRNGKCKSKVFKILYFEWKICLTSVYFCFVWFFLNECVICNVYLKKIKTENVNIL